MKRFLLSFVLSLLGMTSALAAEPYAYYSNSNYTLTFYYGTKPQLEGLDANNIFSLNTGDESPKWTRISDIVNKVVFDPSFAQVRPTSTRSWFNGMEYLTTITGMEYLNTEEVTNMAHMFDCCTSLTHLDLSNFNTSKVTDMNHMFTLCRFTNLNLTSFNTSKVTNMTYMFWSCGKLETITVSDKWNTDKVTNSYGMFDYNYKLVGGAGTAYDENHVDASYAHIDGGTSNPGYLTGVSACAVYDATTQTLTFYYDALQHSGTVGPMPTSATTQPWWSQDSNISANVQHVVFDPSFAYYHSNSGYYWFASMTNLSSITGMEYFKTDEMENMHGMFRDCSSLDSIDLSHFNTRYVKDMGRMFYGCSGLTSLDVSNFSTHEVNNMFGMFNGCSSLTNLDLSNFSTWLVTDMGYMFNGCSSLTSLDVSSFDTQKVTSMLDMFASCNSLTTLDLSSFDTNKVTNMASMFASSNNLTTVTVSPLWSTDLVNQSSYMFRYCRNIVGGAGTTFNSSHTDAAYARIDGGPDSSTPGYFTASPIIYAVHNTNDSTLTLYYDNQYTTRPGNVYTYSLQNNYYGAPWTRNDVKQVIFDSSFAQARPISTNGWFQNMSKLTTITGMQYLNTSEVRNMGKMFYNCYQLQNIDLSHFNTSEVGDMNSMFAFCTHLASLDLSSFNTSEVTNMAAMFESCYKFTCLDLSNFNTSKATNMSHMFRDDSRLKTIVAGNGWDTNAVTASNDMFSDCLLLEGCNGTTYDANHVDVTYARIDGGPDSNTPGYLSDRDYSKYIKYEGLWYEIRNTDYHEVRLVAPLRDDNYTGEAIIPKQFDIDSVTWYVTSIDSKAFTGTDVTRVDVPSSVTSIGTKAFYGARQLTTLVLGTTSNPDYISWATPSIMGNNASGFCCFVNNTYLDKFIEKFTGRHIAPWVIIDNSGYRAFSCSMTTIIPEGLTAYSVTNYDLQQRKAKVTRLTTSVLPCHTGLLLAGEGGARYLLAEASENMTGTGSANYLMPYLTAEDAPANQSTDNAYFYFKPNLGQWTSTGSLQSGYSYLGIPKAMLGNDLTSPILLDLGYVAGDVNGDGDVNVIDITALIDEIMNDGTNPRADVNGDGEINVIDITALIDIIMNS